MSDKPTTSSTPTTVFPDEFAQLIGGGECLLLVFSKPVDRQHEPKLTIRPVTIRGAAHFQFTIKEGTKERHENLTPDDTIARCGQLFAAVYRECYLYTAEADLSARGDGQGAVRIKRSAPTRQAEDSASAHNRPKQYLIPEGEVCPFLVEMGVMSKAGKVIAAKSHKFRQINRFLEYIRDVVPELPQGRPWNIIDFGCGKSYLTFAIHYLLTHVFQHDVRIIGLDRNAEIIGHCAEVSRRLNCTGLEFQVGEIASFAWGDPVDMVVSLHACDTATDDVLAQAVAWKTGVILAVPCCQHEVADRLDSPALALMQKHGIVKERLSALATDALRAQVLEICGYRTQIIEFIDWEHTPKNLLIRAIRRPDGFDPAPQLLQNYQELKRTLGLDELHLERQLTNLACGPFAAQDTLEMTQD